MAGIIIPEGIIEFALQKSLDHIRADYNGKVDKSTSLLLRIMDNQSIGSFNYSEQLVKSLITKESDPKHITIKQSYDPNDQEYPTVYVNMNEESGIHNSIGQGIGNKGLGEDDYYYYDDSVSPNTKSETYARTSSASFFITIVGDNKNEVIGLYRFFKLLITIIGYHLELSGLQNVQIGGKGSVFDSRIPAGIFIKVITMNFEFEEYAPDFYSEIAPSLINLTGTMKEELS